MLLSEEQETVVAAVNKGQHVTVVATAGAGKTTLAATCLSSLGPEQKAILVTFNRALVDRTKIFLTQTLPTCCERIGVFTFHALASSLLGETVHNDLLMMSALDRLEASTEDFDVWSFHDFQRLVIDEAQDLRPMHVRLLYLLLFRVSTQRAAVQIMIIGDDKQLLYDFYPHSSADARYLLQSQRLFGAVNAREWTQHRLTNTFRLNEPMCRVVNKLHGDRMIAAHARDKAVAPVQFVVLDVYAPATSEFVLETLRSTVVPLDKTMLLSGSLNRRSPLVSIVDTLVRAGIPIQRESATNEVLARGRVQCLTFCGSKGLEADFVILVHARPMHELWTQNSLFVALTRAKQQLLVLQHFAETTLPDLQLLIKDMAHSDLRVLVKTKPRGGPSSKQGERPLTVLDLNAATQFMDVIDLQALLTAFVDIEKDDRAVPASEPISMIHTFDHGRTFMDLQSIFSWTMILALEYTQSPLAVPVLLSDVRSVNQRARALLKAACEGLLKPRVASADIAESCDLTLDRLPFLAMGALCLEADHGCYLDKMLGVTHFQWVHSPLVAAHFRALWATFQSLAEEGSSVIWHPKTTLAIRDVSCAGRCASAHFDSHHHVHFACSVQSTFPAEEALTAAMTRQRPHSKTLWVLNVLTRNLHRVHCRSAPEELIEAVIRVKTTARCATSDEAFERSHRDYLHKLQSTTQIKKIT